MSVTASAIRKMVQFGLSADQIADLCDALEEGAVPSALEKRRAYDRERKRNSGGKSGGIDAEQSGGKSGGIPPEKPALACVIDNNPLTEDYNLTLPEARDECAWPESDQPSKADLDRLEGVLRSAASPALHAVSPRLFDLSPILRLAKRGQGPPCDLSADVLPVIRARSAKALPGSVKSWDFYTEAILEARNRRLSGAPALETVSRNERHDTPSAKRLAREDNLSRGLAAAHAVSRPNRVFT